MGQQGFVTSGDLVSEIASVRMLEPVRVGWRIHSLGLLSRPTELRVDHASLVVALAPVGFDHCGLRYLVMVCLVRRGLKWYDLWRANRGLLDLRQGL